MAKFLVIHGPNLNMLGKRETELYGNETLKAINDELVRRAKKNKVESFQSNAEHEIVEKIQSAAKDKVNCIIINPAAFTHTSIAIRDALIASQLPFFEVHLSNIYARESFRHYSYLSDIAQGVVSGFGAMGYFVALERAIEQFS